MIRARETTPIATARPGQPRQFRTARLNTFISKHLVDNKGRPIRLADDIEFCAGGAARGDGDNVSTRGR